MKPRNTAILLLIAAALMAFIILWEKRQPTTREAESLGRRVVNFERDDIDGVTITNNDGRIELRKTGAQWRLELPAKDRANSSAVDSVLTGAETLIKQETISASEPNAAQRVQDFGLAESNTRLKLLGKGAPPELIFGKESAIAGKGYVRLEGSNTIYVVSEDLKNLVTKGADFFRDHRLTEITVQQVEKCLIKNSDGEIELQKTGPHWDIRKPIKARGDDKRIADFMAQALNTPIARFISDISPNANIYGLADSKHSISFFELGKQTPVELQFGVAVDKEPDKVYAKLSSRNPVFALPKSLMDSIAIKPNDLRDRDLVRFEMDIVDRINIEPLDKPKVVLGRSEEKWQLKSLGDKPANSAAVIEMVNALQRQQVTAFVADTASDLAKYGLDEPQLKVTLSSYASENTAETVAGENAIVRIEFGQVDGDNVFARLENEPFVVSVNKSILDPIYTDPVKWQDLTIFKFKPEEITALTITKENQNPVALVRDPKKSWISSAGSGSVDQTNAQSLGNTLSSLHAVRWVGRDTIGWGFENPALTVAFNVGENKSIKLVIGHETNGLRYAMTDITNGVFCISKPDFEALILPLLPLPPQPSPSAPANPSRPGFR
jgi:hypothetical protein